jgi:hypothetical protein
MEMRRAILRHQGKDGNIVAEEEVVIIMTIDDYRKIFTSRRGGSSRRGEGRGWFGDEEGILKQPGKVGNIVAGKNRDYDEDDDYQRSSRSRGGRSRDYDDDETITKDLHVSQSAEEAGIMMMTTTIIKDLHAVVANGAVVMKKTMTIINGLQVVAEVRAVAREEVGMEMRKDIRKQLWKDGSIGEEEVDAAMTMMTMTIIKDLHVAVAEVYAREAEVGLAMKEDIPARPGKVGEIGINFLNWHFRGGYTGQMAQCTFFL